MDIDPTAQGQQAPAETASAENQVSPGVQARFDELTKRVHEAERLAQEKGQEVQQLVASLAEVMASNARAQHQPQEPEVEIDDTEMKKIQRVVGPMVQALGAKLDALAGSVGQRQWQEAASQEDPAVVALAQKRMAEWRKAGYTGWREEDAITFAAGEIARKQRQEAMASQRARSGMNGAAGHVLTHQSGHAQAVPADNELPANFDALPPSKQLEILEKRLEGKTF